eukprot:6365292-Pyramimonas_sp.AAC.1
MKNFTRLVCCRRLCALELATSARIHHRWIPSERNPVDKGSRLWEHLRLKHGQGPSPSGNTASAAASGAAERPAAFRPPPGLPHPVPCASPSPPGPRPAGRA